MSDEKAQPFIYEKEPESERSPKELGKASCWETACSLFFRRNAVRYDVS